MNEIGKEIGIINVQMDNLVNELSAEGYIIKSGLSKIQLTTDGRKRVEI
jgi:Mn-dependent DtxR family transcriptional regulator